MYIFASIGGLMKIRNLLKISLLVLIASLFFVPTTFLSTAKKDKTKDEIRRGESKRTKFAMESIEANRLLLISGYKVNVE